MGSAVMALPTELDYQTAIQNPSACFSDADLKGGVVEKDGFGLPKPRSGNFATVYKVTAGGIPWAVRCFTKEIHRDQKERYEAISSHLGRLKLPYCVKFEFQSRGILIQQ